MERAPSPTSAPISPGPPLATHAIPVLDAEAGPDPYTELRELAASLRSHLGWLREGGVSGLPRSPHKPARPRVAPATAESIAPPPAARPARPIEQSEPHRYEEPTASQPEDAFAAAQAALQASLRAASGTPRAERSAYTPTAPAPALLKEILPTVHYPELDDPDLVRLPAAAALTQVRQILGDCRRCKLCHGRSNIVFGEGNPEPWLVFVGEGPGADEDRTGIPFVGAAGELLDRMIGAMATEAAKRGHPELSPYLSRPQVYIANVVKCRPPGNRTPEPDEIAACTPFLHAQLRALRPRVIVTLGRTPTHYMLNTGAPISRLRGQFTEWNGIPVMPTYHPAYLLRTPSAKQQVWEDLKQVIDLLGRLSLSPAPSEIT
jgi:DNA polymerase